MADFPTAKTNAVDNVTDVLAKHINNLENKVGIDSSTDTSSLDYKVHTLQSALPSGAIVGTTDTQTLTNKTIDGDNNTLQDINPASIKGGLDGWIPAGETWTYASATTFTISGDKRGKYQKEDKIKLTQTSVKYFYVTNVSYSSPNTTITVTGGSDYSLADATITSPYFSKIENPQGFPINGFSYTPTISTTANAGTFSNVKFRLVGDMCFFRGRVTYANALASGNLTFTLPIPFASYMGSSLPIGMAHYFNQGILDARCFVNTWYDSGVVKINFPYMDGSAGFTGNYVNSAGWSANDFVDWQCSYLWI